ncbi:hypothetical protein V8F06_009220 [Rhypophila decipiens]
MAIGTVTDTGLSVVYEPEEPSAAIVDIVFVHGLQGHPRGTWTKTKVPKSPHHQSVSESGNLNSFEAKKAKWGSLSWISKKVKRKSLAPGQGGIDSNSVGQESSEQAAVPSLDPSSRNTTNLSAATASGSKVGVFWPADLLPQACPRARVLVFGYDTKITNYGVASTNKNSIYSHAKDLLFALSRETEGCVCPGGKRRQIIFVAHSLGGIVVKEMLSRSSISTEPQHARIVESTAAVVFLGTPHRGSPDFAAAGEWAQSFVRFFGAETSPGMLHALGLKTTDLERAQESFSGLWLKHNFQIKTFQEGLGLTGINIGPLGDKVVPDYSSSLGDQREHAETIQANHREMCRFHGADDPGYRQVSGELQLIYLTIEKHASTALRFRASFPPHPPQARSIASSVSNQRTSMKSSMPVSVNSFDLWGIDKVPFTETEKAFLTSLWYPNMNSRRRTVTTPADGTCNWLFDNPAYMEWINGQSQQFHDGLLQVQGSPGSGKSVLVKEAYNQALQKFAGSGYSIASYFFHGNGGPLEKSREGVLRSLLYQLLPQDRKYLAKASKEFSAWSNGIVDQVPRAGKKHDAIFPVEQLERTLCSFLTKPPRQRSAGRTLIFIDALNECSSHEDRMALAYFLGATGGQATKFKVKLSILISNRNYPMLTVGSRPDKLDMNQLNEADIYTYVEQRLTMGITAGELERSQLLGAITKRARGVFLWAALAADRVIDHWQQGQGFRQLLRHLNVLPRGLRDLYADLLDDVPKERELVTLRLFQWATLATRPLQLREWHDLMAFISRTTAPRSLKACRKSDDFTTTDDQLVRKIRALSKGLLDVAVDTEEPDIDAMARSVSQFAGAGSFMMNSGETRIIQVIHGSVHRYFKLYFKTNTGLSKRPGTEWTASQNTDILGHLSIMNTCLDYLNISELDALVNARIKAAKHDRVNAPREKYQLSQELEEDVYIPNEDSFREGDYKSPIGPEGVDIRRWLAGIAPESQNDCGSQQEVSEDAIMKRLSQHSGYSVHTERLEAYPALMQYATDEFFFHAKYCLDVLGNQWHDADKREQNKSGLQPIMNRLCDQGFSKRWLALREELGVEYSVDATKPWSFSEYLLRIEPKFLIIFPDISLPLSPPALPIPPLDGNISGSHDSFALHKHERSSSNPKNLHARCGDDKADFRCLSSEFLPANREVKHQKDTEPNEYIAKQMPPGADTFKDHQDFVFHWPRSNTSWSLPSISSSSSEDSVERSRIFSPPRLRPLVEVLQRPPAEVFRIRRVGSVGSFRSAATSGGSRHSRG